MCADINLSGSVSTTGTAILGRFNVIFTSDTDHTLSVTEYTNQFLNVTSSLTLTSQHELIAPLVQGLTFIVNNVTTGGQAINLIGTSGNGVIISNGQIVAVVCDGTNYSETSGGATGQTKTFLLMGA